MDISESLPILNGYEVGDKACELYPGVMVEYDQGLSKAIEETARLVADESVTMIHEATFNFDNVLVRVDLLKRKGIGWNLIEVKGSTSVKDYHLNDAAVQAWVLQGCGLELASVQLMHINNHLRVWRATHAGAAEFDAAEIQPLKEMEWPRYYLDFETIGFAVPRWKGQRPYMQVPFQWSCNTHHENGRMELEGDHSDLYSDLSEEGIVHE